jgi:hypothetical protein
MAQNWMDPQVIARTTSELTPSSLPSLSRAQQFHTGIYGAFVLVLSGLAAWDVLSTLFFDISIIRGKRPWRWPMVCGARCRRLHED